VIGGIADPVHRMIRELGRDQPQQLPGQLDRTGGVLARPQPKQHRQAHRGRAPGQPNHDPGHHPPVAPRDLPPALRRAVMSPQRVMNPATPSREQRVVDHHDDGPVVAQQPRHDTPRHDQAQPVNIPHRLGEDWEKNRHAA
jgi:hypothetical protein